MPALRRRMLRPCLGLLLACLLSTAFATGVGPMPLSLRGVAPPPVPGLLDGPTPIVIDRAAAIALGKALFWDVAVGADGMACASCHFHAGADSRVKNQLAPGGASTPSSARRYAVADDATSMGPNRQLAAKDFPFHQRYDPLDPHSATLREPDQVGGSAGSFGGEFGAVGAQGAAHDACSRAPDPHHSRAGIGARRVTPRNAPSVINAAFNHRGFWDGRANQVFNGSSPWGERDPAAGVWVRNPQGVLVRERLRLGNSALASLATAAALSDTEMACRGRTMAELGRKLLLRKPLAKQRVHHADGVLGAWSTSSRDTERLGLVGTYRGLVMAAFARRYWSMPGAVPLAPPPGRAPYSQMEANFAMFFALSIQLYLDTLISDDAPFDRSARDAAQVPVDLSAAELRGLAQFRRNLCALCHLGPAFTSAAIHANAALAPRQPLAFGEPGFFVSVTGNVVDRVQVLDSTPVTAFHDTGFAATGVARASHDVGLGGYDEFGQPLSFSKQYLAWLSDDPSGVFDAEVTRVRPCDFQRELAVNAAPRYLAGGLFTPADGIRPQLQDTVGCFLPAARNAYLPTVTAARADLAKSGVRKLNVAVDAAFKIPGLRNVELTGPYMHDGSMATLEQVVEFYARGGNYQHGAKQVTRVFAHPELQLDAGNRADLVAFMKTLTDERVRFERAPFDHPALRIPHGHLGDHQVLVAGHALGDALAQDEFLDIEAVGADGRPTPLRPFAELLP